MNLPENGLVAVVKRDCETCGMTEPVLAALAEAGSLTVFTQDDPAFPESVAHEYDASLDVSHALKIEVVPTLLRREGGREVARTYGWNKAEWRDLTGVATLGEDLPNLRPGCGAKNIEPGIIEDLLVRHGETGLKAAVSTSAPRKTRSKRCSIVVGPTGSRWCRQPRRASFACSTAPPATHKR